MKKDKADKDPSFNNDIFVLENLNRILHKLEFSFTYNYTVLFSSFFPLNFKLHVSLT